MKLETPEIEVIIERDYKRLETPFLRDPTPAIPPRVNQCPEDWLIDGREPNNWRKHRGALATEAKAFAAEDRVRLDKLLYDAPFDVAVRSPLLGRVVVKEWKRSMRPRRRAKDDL